MSKLSSLRSELRELENEFDEYNDNKKEEIDRIFMYTLYNILITAATIIIPASFITSGIAINLVTGLFLAGSELFFIGTLINYTINEMNCIKSLKAINSLLKEIKHDYQRTLFKYRTLNAEERRKKVVSMPVSNEFEPKKITSISDYVEPNQYNGRNHELYLYRDNTGAKTLARRKKYSS